MLQRTPSTFRKMDSQSDWIASFLPSFICPLLHRQLMSPVTTKEPSFALTSLTVTLLIIRAAQEHKHSLSMAASTRYHSHRTPPWSKATQTYQGHAGSPHFWDNSTPKGALLCWQHREQSRDTGLPMAGDFFAERLLHTISEHNFLTPFIAAAAQEDGKRARH